MHKLLYTILISIIGVGIATPAFALTVSPPRVEITGDPGTTIYSEIEVFNEQEGTRTFFTSFENFEPSGDTGAPRFIGAKDGLATWIEANSKVTLQSGERVVVPFSITIPQNAEPGGYFAAIFFGSQAPGAQGGGEVSIGGKIGVLILLRVSGEVAEGGGLLEFSTKDRQRFFTTLPITFAYRINNTGGDRIVPHGEVIIKNTLQITSAKLLANDKEGSVLPSSARKFEVLWGEESVAPAEAKSAGFFEMVIQELKDFHFGWYRANLNLVWGDDLSQTAFASYSFFVIPWHLLLVLIVFLAIVWFAGRFGLRRYNRFIIAQAERRR